MEGDGLKFTGAAAAAACTVNIAAAAAPACHYCAAVAVTVGAVLADGGGV